jgi:uncharacterized protein
MHVTERLATYPAGPDRTVVCNALTGEVSVVTDAGVRSLAAVRDGTGTELDPAVLDDLVRRHLVFPRREDEEAHFAQVCTVAWERFLAEAPRHYTLILNTHCNFACPYCFESTDQRAVRSTLTVAQVDAAFAVIDADGGPPPQVELFGGEPLLPGTGPVLEHALRALADRGGGATLQTNGWHLATHLPLLRRYDGVVRQLQVTLDGPAAVHDRRRVRVGGQGTFERIVAGLDAVHRSDLRVGVNVRTNVDRDNLASLDRLAALYASTGWSADDRFTFTAAPVDNRGGGVDPSRIVGWDELFDVVAPLSVDAGGGPFDLGVFKVLGFFRSAIGRAVRGLEPADFVPRVNYCEAVALKLLVFHPDGSVYPCPEVLGQPRHAIGTYDPVLVLDEARAAPWRQQTVLGRESCHTCPISTFCGGGCRLAAISENGTGDVPACEHARELVQAWFGRLDAALRREDTS